MHTVQETALLLFYTVVGYFRDNDQPFTCPIRAPFPEAAAEAAVREMLDINGWDEDYADNIAIVAILGHNPDADVIDAYYLPGVALGVEFLPEAAPATHEVEDVMASVMA